MGYVGCFEDATTRIGFLRNHQKANRAVKKPAVTTNVLSSNIPTTGQRRRRKRGLESEEQCENGEDDGMYVPSNFPGSRSYHSEKTADLLYTAMMLKQPTWLITYVFNPNCPEMQEVMREKAKPSQTVYDFANDMARIFEHQVKQLCKKIRKDHKTWGKGIAMCRKREYQGRGLPHVHIAYTTDFDGDPEILDRAIQSYCRHRIILHTSSCH